MMVQPLPIHRDGSGSSAEQVGGEMRDLYPGQNAAGVGQIFQMLADRLGVAQIMILPDQVFGQLLLGRSADLTQFDGAKIAWG